MQAIKKNMHPDERPRNPSFLMMAAQAMMPVIIVMMVCSSSISPMYVWRRLGWKVTYCTPTRPTTTTTTNAYSTTRPIVVPLSPVASVAVQVAFTGSTAGWWSRCRSPGIGRRRPTGSAPGPRSTDISGRSPPQAASTPFRRRRTWWQRGWRRPPAR